MQFITAHILSTLIGTSQRPKAPVPCRPQLQRAAHWCVPHGIRRCSSTHALTQTSTHPHPVPHPQAERRLQRAAHRRACRGVRRVPAPNPAWAVYPRGLGADAAEYARAGRRRPRSREGHQGADAAAADAEAAGGCGCMEGVKEGRVRGFLRVPRDGVGGSLRISREGKGMAAHGDCQGRETKGCRGKVNEACF
eukprot:365866-Chlamydomonas_euryale.AAC.13